MKLAISAACVVLVAALVFGCGKASVTISPDGDIEAVVTSSGSGIKEPRGVSKAQKLMEAACKERGWQLAPLGQETPSSGGASLEPRVMSIREIIDVTAITKEVYGWFPSHTVTIQGKCITVPVQKSK